MGSVKPMTSRKTLKTEKNYSLCTHKFSCVGTSPEVDLKMNTKRNYSEHTPESTQFNKKIRTYSRIVVKDLSKAFVNNQNRVCSPIWLNEFPIIQLKMVDQDSGGPYRQEEKIKDIGNVNNKIVENTDPKPLDQRQLGNSIERSHDTKSDNNYLQPGSPSNLRDVSVVLEKIDNSTLPYLIKKRVENEKPVSVEKTDINTSPFSSRKFVTTIPNSPVKLPEVSVVIEKMDNCKSPYLITERIKNEEPVSVEKTNINNSPFSSRKFVTTIPNSPVKLPKVSVVIEKIDNCKSPYLITERIKNEESDSDEDVDVVTITSSPCSLRSSEFKYLLEALTEPLSVPLNMRPVVRLKPLNELDIANLKCSVRKDTKNVGTATLENKNNTSLAKVPVLVCNKLSVDGTTLVNNNSTSDCVVQDKKEMHSPCSVTKRPHGSPPKTSSLNVQTSDVAKKEIVEKKLNIHYECGKKHMDSLNLIIKRRRGRPPKTGSPNIQIPDATKEGNAEEKLNVLYNRVKKEIQPQPQHSMTNSKPPGGIPRKSESDVQPIKRVPQKGKPKIVDVDKLETIITNRRTREAKYNISYKETDETDSDTDLTNQAPSILHWKVVQKLERFTQEEKASRHNDPRKRGRVCRVELKSDAAQTRGVLKRNTRNTVASRPSLKLACRLLNTAKRRKYTRRVLKSPEKAKSTKGHMAPKRKYVSKKRQRNENDDDNDQEWVNNSPNTGSFKKLKAKPKCGRSKKKRCKKCENCLRPNCGDCIFCKDMKKYGGDQILKQCCLYRKCLFKSYVTPSKIATDVEKEEAKRFVFALSSELQELADSKEPFLQDRPCWKLPKYVSRCRQCAFEPKLDCNVCRFFSFRQLQFMENNLLQSVGFASTSTSSDDYLRLLTPHVDESLKLDFETAKYILSHVGKEFCDLVNEEKSIKQRFGKDTVGLKNAIQGVREMCDICETTVFNFHFSCKICGFVACIDCYDGNPLMWMACTDKERAPHSREKFVVTQIISGDVLWDLGQTVHSIARKQNIGLNCSCTAIKIENSERPYNGINKELMQNVCSMCENGESKDTKATESPPGSPRERKPLSVLTAVINCFINTSDIAGTFEEKRRKIMLSRYPIPTERNAMNPIRIMTKTESLQMFPNIPHSWLCEGRLLLLHDPRHLDNNTLFQEFWKRGQPIVVGNVHQFLDCNLWNPDNFSRDFGALTNDLIDCFTGAIVPLQQMKIFWDGFQNPDKRLKDTEGRPRLLKLRDWPPGDDFSEVLPSRFEDLMQALPLPDYTRRDGKLNLTSHLPSYFVPPDLGPKMYIAYGSTENPNQGTTNLHLDMSDAVNVMVYVGIIQNENKQKQIDMAHAAIREAGCDYMTLSRIREGKAQLGAIWHIYMSRDAPKIRAFLNKLAAENGSEVQPNNDPIHDQSWYLDDTLRRRLYDEYGVEGYAIAQCVGDAVFIPAGAPHQVRNLHSCIKVAEDFVTPENVGHCLTLTQEFRHLSKSHTNHEDKLQVKNIIYHAIKDALSVILTKEANEN